MVMMRYLPRVGRVHTSVAGLVHEVGRLDPGTRLRLGYGWPVAFKKGVISKTSPFEPLPTAMSGAVGENSTL